MGGRHGSRRPASLTDARGTPPRVSDRNPTPRATGAAPHSRHPVTISQIRARLFLTHRLTRLPPFPAQEHGVAASDIKKLVELARRGRVTVDDRSGVSTGNAGAKCKAALVVAALLGGCVPDSVPRVLRAVIGSYL